MFGAKSLTAVVHVKFNYSDEAQLPVSEDEIRMMGTVLDKASKLDTETQEILIRFADYLKEVNKNQNPG
ncbi:hypothetical protein ES708_19595 [subsurface metagenome]